MLNARLRLLAMLVTMVFAGFEAGYLNAQDSVLRRNPFPKPLLQSAQGEAIDDLVSFSPDKQWLAIAGRDPTIGIWDTSSGREYGVLSGHLTFVISLSFGADGRQLVSVGKDRTVRVWNFLDLQEVWNSSPIASEPTVAVLSPDDKLLAVGTRDGTILLYKTETWQTKGKSTGHGYINTLLFTNDGKTVISGDAQGYIALTNVSDVSSETFISHRSSVNCLAVSTSGDKMLSGDNDGHIILWSLRSKTQLGSQALRAGVLSVAFDAANNRIVAASKEEEIGIWDYELRRRFLHYVLPVNPSMDLLIFSVATLPIVLSADGSWVTASPGLGVLIIFDTATRNTVKTLKNAIDGVRSVAVNPQSHQVAIGTSEGQVALWDFSLRGEQYATLTGHTDPVTSLHFNPAGTLLVSADDSVARTWSWPTLKPALMLKNSTGGFVYADEHWFASGSDLGPPVTKIWPLDKSQPPRILPIKHFMNVNGIVISPNGELAASWSHLGGDIKVWTIATGSELLSIDHSDYVAYVGTPVFSPSSKLLAWGTWKGDVRLLDLESKHGTRLRGHVGQVNYVAFSGDGTLLASAGQDKTLRIFEVSTGKQLKMFTGHSSGVRFVSFSIDRKQLISAGSDGTTRFWDLDGGDELFSLSTLRDRGGWLIVSPNGLFDGSADAINSLGWRVPNSHQVVPLDAFYNDFFHPGLLSQIFEGENPKPPYDLATRLRFPALRTMAQQGLASIQKRDGKILLCLARQASPSSVKGLRVAGRGPGIDIGTEGFKETPEDAVCTYSKELPPNQGPYELVGTTTGWKSRLKDSKMGRDSNVSQSTLHVFTVGIDKYHDVYSHLYFPVADADAIESFFNTQKQSRKLFADVRIWPGLRDETATKQAIRDQLSAMAKEVKEDDVVFLFFSGHGRVPPGQEMFYYIPFQSPSPDSSSVVDPNEERATAVSTAMLAEAIRNLRARRVVLVVDACQSGGAVESLGKIGEVKLAVEQRRAREEQASRETSHDHEVGVYILAAATPVQEALEPVPEMKKDNKENSLLTAVLLQALNGKTSSLDSEIGVASVFDAVKRDLPRLAKKYASVQTAFPVTVGVDFPIARR